MKADVIIFVLMAVFGEVPQPEVEQACEEREVALERALEGWERDVIKAFLTDEKLKAATPEERLSIPDYKASREEIISRMFFGNSLESKHLKGQLGPRVGDVLFC